jgi:acyl-coenzyme A thioesterase PaaI-like protein
MTSASGANHLVARQHLHALPPGPDARLNEVQVRCTRATPATGMSPLSLFSSRVDDFLQMAAVARDSHARSDPDAIVAGLLAVTVSIWNLRAMTTPAWLLRRLINIWGPFRGAGIVVTSLADDWSHARVVLKERLLNRNYVGTHFGGSLFAMTDPFYMLMLMHRLGKGYRVWDRAASIDFLSPGRGTLIARVRKQIYVRHSNNRRAAESNTEQ